MCQSPAWRVTVSIVGEHPCEGGRWPRARGDAGRVPLGDADPGKVWVEMEEVYVNTILIRDRKP